MCRSGLRTGYSAHYSRRSSVQRRHKRGSTVNRSAGGGSIALGRSSDRRERRQIELKKRPSPSTRGMSALLRLFYAAVNSPRSLSEIPLHCPPEFRLPIRFLLPLSKPLSFVHGRPVARYLLDGNSSSAHNVAGETGASFKPLPLVSGQVWHILNFP